jgi:hypothetical protein
MDSLSSFTSTSLGYLIALFVPGVFGLYAVGLFAKPVHRVLRTFYTSGSGIGLFFMVMMIGLGIGMVLLAIRGLIYERWIRSGKGLQDKEFARLSEVGVLAGHRAAVDEDYRYHQCWGALSLVVPVAGVGLIWDNRHRWDAGTCALLAVGTLAVEFVLIWAAIVAYDRYVARSKDILGTKGDV